MNSLLSTTQSYSVIFNQRKKVSYTPFGYYFGRRPSQLLGGFNGELIEQYTGRYLLGSGHRAYSPSLMRFDRSDFFSPFYKGGLNSYAYANGDPVNNIDTSGYFPLKIVKSIFSRIGRNASINPQRQYEPFTRNVRFASKDMYLFDDITSRGRRLNVVVHGGPSRAIFSDDKVLGPEQFAMEVDKFVPDYTAYQHARMLICYSAEATNGAKSIGEYFAQHSGLKTKAFFGSVHIAEGNLLGLDALLASPRLLGSNETAKLEGVTGYDFSIRHEIFKPPYSFAYRKHYFQPLTEVVVHR